MPSATRSSRSAGRPISRPSRGSMEAGQVLGQLRRSTAARPERLEDPVAELEPAIEGGQVRLVAGQQLAVDPHVRAVASRRSRDLLAADRAEGPARLGHGLVPLGRRVAAPCDAAADVERQPRPSATNVRMRMLVCIAPSGPIQPSAPVYGPRRTGSRPSRISMARIFGAPVIEPPGKLAASRSKASRPSAQPAGDGRDEVLDGRGSFQPAQPRDADRAGLADAAEVVAQDVDDHHVLGAVLGAGQQLAREPAILGAVAAARSRALDRVGGDQRRRVDREERLRRGRQEGPRPAVLRTGPGPGTRRTAPGRRCAAGGTAATGRPERRLEPAGEVRLVDLARGDVLPDRSTPASYAARDREDRKRSVSPARGAGGRRSVSAVAAVDAGVVSRACTSSSRRASRRPSPSSARPPSQAWPVRRSQATTQSWSARRSGGRPWSSSATDGSRSRTCPRSYPRNPTSPPRNGGASAGTTGVASSRPTSRRATAKGSGPAAGASRTATGRRSGRSSALPARAGALEQGKARQIAERLGDVDRSPTGDPLRAGVAAEARPWANRAWLLSRRGSPGDDTAGGARRPVERPRREDAGSLQSRRCEDAIWGSGSAPARRATQCHHGRRRRDRRPHDPHPWRRAAACRRGTGPDRRHGRLPARHGLARAGLRRLSPAQRQRRADRARVGPESGMLASPVAITNTHSVGVVRDALVDGVGHASRMPLVAPGGRRDVRRAPQRHQRLPRPTRTTSHEALADATGGPVAEGTVGGGTGMICHEFKGGIGTASRVIARPPAAGRSASSSRRTTAGATCCGSTACRSAGDPDLRGAEPIRASVGRPRSAPTARARVRSSWSSRRMRRSCPTSARGSRSGRSRNRAHRRHGREHERRPVHRLCDREPLASSRGRRAPVGSRHVRGPRSRRHRHRPALRGDRRGDRGVDPQRAARRDHDRRSRRHHRPRTRPRTAARGHGRARP